MYTNETWMILSFVVIALVIGVIALVFFRRKQSQRLQQRFGSEYGRAVDSLGGRAKAEAELKERETRVDHLKIVALAPAEAARFAKPGRRCKDALSTIPRAWSYRPISSSGN